jgi:hypothetical protein
MVDAEEVSSKQSTTVGDIGLIIPGRIEKFVKRRAILWVADIEPSTYCATPAFCSAVAYTPLSS